MATVKQPSSTPGGECTAAALPAAAPATAPTLSSAASRQWMLPSLQRGVGCTQAELERLWREQAPGKMTRPHLSGCTHAYRMLSCARAALCSSVAGTSTQACALPAKRPTRPGGTTAVAVCWRTAVDWDKLEPARTCNAAAGPLLWVESSRAAWCPAPVAVALAAAAPQAASLQQQAHAQQRVGRCAWALERAPPGQSAARTGRQTEPRAFPERQPAHLPIVPPPMPSRLEKKPAAAPAPASPAATSTSGARSRQCCAHLLPVPPPLLLPLPSPLASAAVAELPGPGAAALPSSERALEVSPLLPPPPPLLLLLLLGPGSCSARRWAKSQLFAGMSGAAASRNQASTRFREEQSMREARRAPSGASATAGTVIRAEAAGSTQPLAAKVAVDVMAVASTAASDVPASTLRAGGGSVRHMVSGKRLLAGRAAAAARHPAALPRACAAGSPLRDAWAGLGNEGSYNGGSPRAGDAAEHPSQRPHGQREPFGPAEVARGAKARGAGCGLGGRAGRPLCRTSRPPPAGAAGGCLHRAALQHSGACSVAACV